MFEYKLDSVGNTWTETMIEELNRRYIEGGANNNVKIHEEVIIFNTEYKGLRGKKLGINRGSQKIQDLDRCGKRRIFF